MPTISPSTTWTSIRDDIASLHLAAESFEELPSEHQPELLELMRLSTQRLTMQLDHLEKSRKVAADLSFQAAPKPVRAQTPSPAQNPFRATAPVPTTASVPPKPAPVSIHTAATAAPASIVPTATSSAATEQQLAQTPIAAELPAQTPPENEGGSTEELRRARRQHRAKRKSPRSTVSVTLLTEHGRCEGTVVNESETGMGVTISLVDPLPISNGQNIRIVHHRRLRLARVVRTLVDASGRFEIGAKWL